MAWSPYGIDSFIHDVAASMPDDGQVIDVRCWTGVTVAPGR